VIIELNHYPGLTFHPNVLVCERPREFGDDTPLSGGCRKQHNISSGRILKNHVPARRRNRVSIVDAQVPAFVEKIGSIEKRVGYAAT
jgi:hypothetical protein